MELQPLTVKPRVESGKGPARRSRVEGIIPAVIYGEGKAPMPVSIELRAFEHIVHSSSGAHAIVQIEVDGDGEGGPAMLKSVQHHPVRNTIVHADLLRIRLDEKIHTSVPLVFIGRPVGVIEGGLQDQQIHELEIECLALETPLQIDVDISHLAIGDNLHVSDIPAPKGVTILTESDRGVVAIHQPRMVKSDGEVGQGTAEVEIVGQESDEEKE